MIPVITGRNGVLESRLIIQDGGGSGAMAGLEVVAALGEGMRERPFSLSTTIH